MAISFKGMTCMNKADALQRKLELGAVKSKLVAINDGEDDYGFYITFQFLQMQTGKMTTSKAKMDSVSYNDDPRGYYEARHDYIKVYVIRKDSDGQEVDSNFLRCIDDIGAQRDDFRLAVEEVGFGEALNALEGQTLMVYYTRTEKGNLVVCFSEAQYNYLVTKRGYIGAYKAIVEAELNEDCPF